MMSLDAVIGDLAGKQRLIDRLGNELDHHTQALQRVAEQAMFEKTQLEQLDEKNEELQRSINAYSGNVLLTSQQMYEASRDDLMFHHIALMQRLKVVRAKSKDQLARIGRLQNQLIQRNGIETKIVKLRQAHESQTAFVRQLMQGIEKTKIFKLTCKRHEQAILRLENLVAKNQSHHDGHIAQRSILSTDDILFSRDTIESPAFTLLEEENRLLQDNIDRLKQKKLPAAVENEIFENIGERIEAEKLKIKELEIRLSNIGKETYHEKEVLLKQTKAAEDHAAQLEEKVKTRSMDTAREAADLEMKILECGMQAFGADYEEDLTFRIGSSSSFAKSTLKFDEPRTASPRLRIHQRTGSPRRADVGVKLDPL